MGEGMFLVPSYILKLTSSVCVSVCAHVGWWVWVLVRVRGWVGVVVCVCVEVKGKSCLI